MHFWLKPSLPTLTQSWTTTSALAMGQLILCPDAYSQVTGCTLQLALRTASCTSCSVALLCGFSMWAQCPCWEACQASSCFREGAASLWHPVAWTKPNCIGQPHGIFCAQFFRAAMDPPTGQSGNNAVFMANRRWSCHFSQLLMFLPPLSSRLIPEDSDNISLDHRIMHDTPGNLGGFLHLT